MVGEGNATAARALFIAARASARACFSRAASDRTASIFAASAHDWFLAVPSRRHTIHCVMGDCGDGFGASRESGAPADSVTDFGGPVLLAATAPELQRGDVLAGRYQIEAVIGTGGSGRVLRAFDRVARTAVALKILRREFAVDPVWSERFARELRVGRQIQNSHVCRVFDIGEAEGNRFLSMELATGGTIRAQIRQSTPSRTLDQRIADARAVIEGVAAIHAAGIVHRDIKPENILRMEDGRLVVSDFGLATDPGAGPATTVMVGTPTYMAPEVVMGDPATARSDVWALGVVLHEILFGRRPDRSISSRGHRRYMPPDLALLTERRLAALCGRCSDDSPLERPTSAVEALREFHHALSGRRHVSKGVARRQLTWAGIAAVSIAAVLLIGNRWTNRAAASSAQVASVIGDQHQLLEPVGTPQDWSQGSTRLAGFTGRIHCFSQVHGDRKIRVIWGSPRRAEDVDVATGHREPSRLLPRTYQQGCPQLSPDGRSLLFEIASDTGSHIFLSASPDGRDAKQIVQGTSPKWLPNGQEFAFAVDSRHVGIFAIPSGDMTVVTDGGDNARQLDEHVVNASGSRLAIRYTTEKPENLVVIHALPSLRVIQSLRVPIGAEWLQFDSSGELLFALNGRDGYGSLAAADLQGTLRNVGKMFHVDIRGALEIGGSLIVVDKRPRKDLWSDRDREGVTLTTDGVSVHGALSQDGALAVQRQLPDGRSIIVLRGADRSEKVITGGPLDVTPAFLPGGSDLLYAKLDGGQLMRCSADTGRCASFHSDPLLPGFPSPDPEGKKLAYLTLMNVSRVRLVSLTGESLRDLGPSGGDSCAPIWTSAHRLWVAKAPSGQHLTWVELDVDTGLRTGDQKSTDTSASLECPIPQALVAKVTGPKMPKVFVVSQETADLVHVSGP
jgi:Protein kinase domain